MHDNISEPPASAPLAYDALEQIQFRAEDEASVVEYLREYGEPNARVVAAFDDRVTLLAEVERLRALVDAALAIPARVDYKHVTQYAEAWDDCREQFHAVLGAA